jgi:hypothetical protein
VSFWDYADKHPMLAFFIGLMGLAAVEAITTNLYKRRP